MGTDRLLLCKYLFADPLGLPFNNFSRVRGGLSFADSGVTEIIQAPQQNFNSNLCGLYCIYTAHYVFDADFPLIPYISEQEFLRLVKHFLRSCLVSFESYFKLFLSKRKQQD